MSKMNVFGSMLALTGALLLGGGCASRNPNPTSRKAASLARIMSIIDMA